MNVLLLCDDYWHPGKVPCGGVKPLEEKGFKFDIITDGLEFKPDMLARYPVVMLCKSNQRTQADKQPWITRDAEEAFTDYVEAGSGLLVVHSGTVVDKETALLGKLIGCRLTYHPNNCPVTVAPILPHPVTQDIKLFCETDEHYRLEIISDDAVAVIASYSPPQGEESKYEEDPYHNTTAWISAAGLVRTQGKGRVCALTPGHLPEVWANGEYQKTLENALRWCGNS